MSSTLTALETVETLEDVKSKLPANLRKDLNKVLTLFFESIQRKIKKEIESEEFIELSKANLEMQKEITSLHKLVTERDKEIEVLNQRIANYNSMQRKFEWAKEACTPEKELLQKIKTALNKIDDDDKNDKEISYYTAIMGQ